MRRLLHEAMDAGAGGWSAQRLEPGSGVTVQCDHDGTPTKNGLYLLAFKQCHWAVDERRSIYWENRMESLDY
jgi:hypothetical protein